LAVPFASMSLFGLSAGEITFQDSIVRREKSPIRFWFYLGLDTLVAGLCVFVLPQRESAPTGLCNDLSTFPEQAQNLEV
jgi:hypothetical protein